MTIIMRHLIWVLYDIDQYTFIDFLVRLDCKENQIKLEWQSKNI